MAVVPGAAIDRTCSGGSERRVLLYRHREFKQFLAGIGIDDRLFRDGRVSRGAVRPPVAASGMGERLGIGTLHWGRSYRTMGQ